MLAPHDPISMMQESNNLATAHAKPPTHVALVRANFALPEQADSALLYILSQVGAAMTLH